MCPEEITVIREAMVLLYDMINHSLDERGRQAGITRYQSMVMERIRGNPGMTQNQLAEMLSATKQYVSQVVMRLEELGLVEAKVPFSDSRKRRLYLTDLGQKRQDTWRADSVQNLENAFGQLSKEKREELAKAFHTLHEVLPQLKQKDITLF